MRTVGVAVRVWLVGAVVVGSLSFTGTEAIAADKAAARCRRAITKGVLAVAKGAFGTIKRCHAQRLKRKGPGDCNALAAAAGFNQARQRALARINLGCRKDKKVVANYNGAPNVKTAFENAVFPAIQRELEQTAGALQTAPSVQGDVKALRKCHGSLGAGWGGVVTGTLQAAFKCQGRRDKRADDFGPLDPGCAGAAGKAGRVATKKIGKTCGAFGGLEVGSCAGLPGCLVTEAEKAGQRIARITFGGPATCGDGVRDPSEACDDGNLVENDGCRANCELPTCGDLSVNHPDEQCDEPNAGISGDEEGQNCFECKLNVCGDGILDIEEPVLEECDDKNATPDDGCTNCTRDPVRCGPNGLTVTMALDFPEDIVGQLGAAQVRLSYPSPLDIPGSGFASTVRQRVTSKLPAGFTFQGPGISSDWLGGFDRDTNGDAVDDQVRVNLLPPLGNGLRTGDVGQAQFDCPAGTEMRPADLPCNVPGDQLGGLDGNPLAPELRPLVRCALTLAPTQ
jgi:cysteine-rich repeat protein